MRIERNKIGNTRFLHDYRTKIVKPGAENCRFNNNVFGLSRVGTQSTNRVHALYAQYKFRVS